MSFSREQGNQTFRAALIYPFLILVLGVISITLSDNFLNALPKEENPDSAELGEQTLAPTEAKSENEPAWVTMTDSLGDATPTPPVDDKTEGAMQQDAERSEKQTTKYPPAVILGIIIQVVQLYLFYQISSITTDLVRATNDISFKVVCGLGFCLATMIIMVSIGKLNSVYASARAGRRAKYEACEGGLYDIFSVISALVIVYSWGRLAWA